MSLPEQIVDCLLEGGGAAISAMQRAVDLWSEEDWDWVSDGCGDVTFALWKLGRAAGWNCTPITGMSEFKDGKTFPHAWLNVDGKVFDPLAYVHGYRVDRYRPAEGDEAAQVQMLADNFGVNDESGYIDDLVRLAAQKLQLTEAQTDRIVSLILTPHSQSILLRRVPPVHPWVKAHHMTMSYKPTIDKLERWVPMEGDRLRVKVLGAAQDEQGQAVAVKGPSDNAIPHITISCADGVSSVYSNDLLARGYKKVAPFWLDGIVTIELLQPRLAEASAPEDYEWLRRKEAGEIEPHVYQDGWVPITPEIADRVGYDFATCCEGSYKGPDKGYVYGQGGKPLLAALIRRGKLDFLGAWKPPQGMRSPTPEERELAQELAHSLGDS